MRGKYLTALSMATCTASNIFLEANCINLPLKSKIHTTCSPSPKTSSAKWINLWLVYATSYSSSSTFVKFWILMLPMRSTTMVCPKLFLPQLPCWYTFLMLSMRSRVNLCCVIRDIPGTELWMRDRRSSILAVGLFGCDGECWLTGCELQIPYFKLSIVICSTSNLKSSSIRWLDRWESSRMNSFLTGPLLELEVVIIL